MMLPCLAVMTSFADAQGCSNCSTGRKVTLEFDYEEAAKSVIKMSGNGEDTNHESTLRINPKLKPDTEYHFTLDLIDEGDGGGSANDKIVFGCGLEYRAKYADFDDNVDGGAPPASTWVKGCVPLKLRMFDVDQSEDPQAVDWRLQVTGFDVRISAEEDNESGDEGAESASNGGSGEANYTTSPPRYHQDPANAANILLAAPEIGVEIPLGKVGMGTGGTAPYRSAGRLVSSGMVSASRSAPTSFQYFGIEEVKGKPASGGNPAIPAIVTYESYSAGSGFALEKVLVTPTRVFRVSGYNGSDAGTLVDFSQAENTLVREYLRDSGDTVSDALSGDVVSSWKVSTAGTVVTVAELVDSELTIRNYESIGSDQLVRSVGPITTTTTTGGLDTSSNTFIEVKTVKRGATPISKTETTYLIIDGETKVLEEARYPDPESNQDALLTSYDYYDADNVPERIQSGDLRWVIQPDGGWTYYQRGSDGVTVYRPFASETEINESIASDDAFPVVPAGVTPTEGGSGRARVTHDDTEKVINYEYWDEENWDYPSPGSDPADIILTDWDSVTVSPFTSISRDYDDDGTFLVHGSLNADSYEISHSYQLSDSERWKAGKPILSVREQQLGNLYSYEKSGSTFTKTLTTGAVSSSSSSGGDEVAGKGVYFLVVPGLSTRTTSIYDAGGLVSTEYFFHADGDFVSAYTDVEHRSENLEYTTRNGVEISRIEKTAPFTVVETDSTGRRTTVVRNELGETVSITVESGGGVPNQTTNYVIDGLTTEIETNGLLTSSTTVDGLGRMVSQTDSLGVETVYEYLNGGRTTVSSRNFVTRTSENYFDGRSKSIGGTGVVNEFYTYDVDDVLTGSLESTTHSIGNSTEHDGPYTIEGFDAEGRREVKIRPSSAPSGGDMEERYTYDFFDGRLLSVESYASIDDTSPQTVQLMVSDLWSDPTIQEIMGADSVSGLDVDADGYLTLGASELDRMQRSTWSYILEGGVIYRQSQQFRYPDGTEANKETTTKLQSLSFVPAGDGYAEISKSISPSGRTITVTRNVDPITKTEVVIENDSATAVVDSTTISVNGYLQSVARAGAAAGKSESYSYDSMGRVESYTNIRGGSTWSIYYNDSFQLKKVVNHLGEETRYDYYGNSHANAGSLWKVTQPGSRVVETSYNTRGEVISTIGNGTYPLAFSYNDYGQRETMTTYQDEGMTGSAVTRWIYNTTSGALTGKRYDDGNAAPGNDLSYEYTWDGKLSKRTTAGNVITTYSYDPSTRDLMGIAYTGEGNRTPDVTFSNFDHFGRPEEVEETLAAVSEVNNAETRTQTLSYQPHSGAVSTEYDSSHPWLPDMSIIQQPDDVLGRPSGFQVKKSETLQTSQAYSYDTLGRLGTVTSSDFNAEHEYLPGTSMLSSVTIRDAGTQQIAMQRVHAIDLLGRVLGTVNKAPGSGLGSTLATVSSVGHKYDSSGRRDDARREDGSWWDYNYNDRSEVTGATKKTSADATIPGQDYGYVYDEIGNRKTATYGSGSNVSTIGYTSNDLNQYTNITHPGTFDLLVRSSGSISATSTAGTTVESISDEDNLYGLRMVTTGTTTTGKESTTTIELLSDTSQTASIDSWVPRASETRTYDPDGNLTNDSRWTYTWDGENRLVKLAPKSGAPEVTLWYSYDYRGRRIGRKVEDARSATTTTTITGFVYDDWNPVAEWDAIAIGSGTPSTSGYVLRRTQLWGLDLGGEGATSYGRANFQDAGGVGGLLAVTCHGSTDLHYLPGYDANGNIISWSDGDGEPLQRMDYDPFGNRIFEEQLSSNTTLLATIPAYGFSTKPQDPGSDLLYYGYRYYDPVTGRWPSRDPIEEDGGVNVYGFVGNDGANQWDNLGQYSTTEEAGHAGARAAARMSIRFDEVYNSDNWTYRLSDNGKEGTDFRLEYAGLVCCAPDEVKYDFTPPHEGVVAGPFPAIVKAKKPRILPKTANYHPATGAVMKIGGKAHAYSDPTYNFATEEGVSCREVFGLGWKMVGHYHSHPRNSGLEPSPGDRTNTLPGKRFLGAVAGDYSIHTEEY